MPITRSYSNAFEVVDYTQELVVIPNSWTLLGDAGIFTEVPVSNHTVTFEEVNKTLGLVGDVVRGGKPNTKTDSVRKIRSYAIPHFPMVDEVLPQDVQGKRAFGSSTASETEAAVVLRKMEEIRKYYDVTKEVARFATLTTGDLYAPNGTIAGNLFTDFGVTQTEVNFALTTTTTDIIAKCEEVIASMQDNAKTGDVITGVNAYCGAAFFASLISHANVKEAYKYYSATAGQEIMRNRAGGTNGLYREFFFGGIRFIEVRTVLAGQTLVPTNTAVFLPTGTNDTFVTYQSPANRFDYLNTLGESAYMWTFRDPKGTKIDIEAEANFLNICKRPALIAKGTRS